ncbi:hypothetical protein FQR65_LT15044 [Abscondita terminalis]|nr:hypothetical protein FQR65_LT15044 [Abscondita terminalis]
MQKYLFKSFHSLHNWGHTISARTVDLNRKFLESFTMMRDPDAFYSWDSYIDSIFEIYKSRLPHYTLSQKTVIEFFNGFIDPVRFIHLQHFPFTYTIKVTNTESRFKLGTCRIFIAPQFDEKGRSIGLCKQRQLIIAMDRFAVTLAQGFNTITRVSTDSTVTIPFEQALRNSSSEDNNCGCGWPHHMLLPKGKPGGYPYQLIVMISDYAEDSVKTPLETNCKIADNYCGV